MLMDDPQDYVDWSDYTDEPEEYPRDSKVDDAQEAILDLFEQNPDQVFYGRQVEVLLEKDFFHWITTKALNELAGSRTLEAEKLSLDDAGKVSVKFYRLKRNRYWKRQAESKLKLVREYSDHEFSRAVGDHGEMMFDAALPLAGFMPKGKNVREYKGKHWTESGHDLDRIFERDGIAYGVEVKNTLKYIESSELATKLQMCQPLAVRPLFIMRFAPKSYIFDIQRQGGFALIFKWQLYPLGYKRLAQRIREELGLPVDTPRAIEEGTIQRFLTWHLSHP